MKGLDGLAPMIAAGALLTVFLSGCASADRWSSDPWAYNATSGYPAVGRGTGGLPADVWEPDNPGNVARWPSPAAADLPFDTYTHYPFRTPGSVDEGPPAW